MKALVYHGPGEKQWETMPDPTASLDTDAIVRVDHSTICGTDLHILKGDVPTCEPGRILGHEGVGTVVEAGAGVRNVKVGDRVIIACISACGKCRYCRAANYGMCQSDEGGWVLGNTVDGVQADYLRTPFADNSLYGIPEELSNEQVIYLSDILATGFEVGVLMGNVQPGDTIVVVGCGPIGLSTMLVSRLYSPGHIVAVDPARGRREFASKFADTVTTPEEVESVVAELTEGLGADVTIEAVGIPETFEMCCDLIRPGGRVANIGVHGHPATLHLEKLWIRDVTITTGIPDCRTVPQLMKAIASGAIDATSFTSHHCAAADMMEAYDIFTRSAETGAVKVLVDHSAAA